jgi:two-component system OmpR family response regulator
MKKILIIDDEQDLCFLLKAYLIVRHNQVIVANTLHDGMFQIKNFHPDILFLDNNLPDGHGWDKVCEIAEENPGMKITLMSGQANYKLISCKEHFNTIEKPLSFEKIDISLN